VIRDNLHTLLVGPLFGKEWIGYYAWAFQICLVSSQVFAQISARVSLPLLAQAKSFQERWSRCLYQVRLLAMLTVPVLCGVWLVLPTMNYHFFRGKWQPAVAIVPLLFLRMVPGIATTPIGPLIMVQKGGRSFAKVSLLWTLAEIAGASLLLFALGPTGLAWSCAVMVWVGLWFMLVALGQNSLDLGKQLIAGLLRHPSFAFLVPATLVLSTVGKSSLAREVSPALPVTVACLLVAVSILLEPDFRGLLTHEKR
jgi:O-antigen/teichoic acid export membrane protein